MEHQVQAPSPLWLTAMIVAATVMLVGCTVTSRGEAGEHSQTSSNTIDITEPGYDPSQQFSRAEAIRDQLQAGGIECDGTVAAPANTNDQVSVGVIAQLNCPFAGGEIQIVVYRTKGAKDAGLANLGWFACAGGWRAEYIEGDVWVVGTVLDGRDESDPAMTNRIAAALDTKPSSFSC